MPEAKKQPVSESRNKNLRQPLQIRGLFTLEQGGFRALCICSWDERSSTIADDGFTGLAGGEIGESGVDVVQGIDIGNQ